MSVTFLFLFSIVKPGFTGIYIIFQRILKVTLNLFEQSAPKIMQEKESIQIIPRIYHEFVDRIDYILRVTVWHHEAPLSVATHAVTRGTDLPFLSSNSCMLDSFSCIHVLLDASACLSLVLP